MATGTEEKHILSKFPETVGDAPIQLPDVGRLDLIRWFRELDFKVGAEIGVAHAELSKLICEVNPQLKLYGVDSWAPYKGYGDYTRDSTFSQMEKEVEGRMRGYIGRDRFEIVKGFSMDVVGQFDDNSLDFVYIDANHQGPFVDEDIREWTKKVRPGGIVAGHDYIKIRRVVWGVKEAIQNYTKEHGLTWYVLGADAESPGQVRDGSRSWMFFRP